MGRTPPQVDEWGYTGPGPTGRASAGSACSERATPTMASSVRARRAPVLAGSAQPVLACWASALENVGLLGISNGTGIIAAGGPDAGFFFGNVSVTGSISKGGGGFTIDHPLDPANRYLRHSFVESAEMKNLYDGIAVCDSNGEAAVLLAGVVRIAQQRCALPA